MKSSIKTIKKSETHPFKINTACFESKTFFWLFIVALICIAFFINLPFGLANSQSGHDMCYHEDCIRALNNAWQNGNFGTRIYGLICQDYGYGNGLFYSMLPAGLTVILMNTLNIGANQAIALLFFFIMALASIFVFVLMKKIFKTNLLAFVLSSFYLLFPYFSTDIYIRFSFSEIFLILTVPMVALGMFELIENSNYKAFIPLFTIGFSLSIFTHLAVSIYVALAGLYYIILRFKKFISGFKYIPFLICCGFVILITACFYIPMLMNYGIVQTSEMNYGGFSLWNDTFGEFNSYFLKASLYITIALTVLFAIVYLRKNKSQKTENEKLMFKLCLGFVVVISPIYPWFLMWGPLSMLQFSWRLFVITSLADCIMFGYIIKNIDTKIYKFGIILGVFIVSIVGVSDTIIRHYSHGQNQSITNAIEYNSSLKTSSGQGAFGKDYHPKNADNNYIFYRANDKMILSASTDIQEFANYQTINITSFIVRCEKEEDVTLNIPYEVCLDIKITEKESGYPHREYEIMPKYQLVDGNKFLHIDMLPGNDYQKVIIEYDENSAFDNYLKQHPFEFVVKSGHAEISEYIKTNSTSYTAKIELTDKAKIELPTLFYTGYIVKLTNENGTKTLTPIHNENGFVEIELDESGILSVEFAPKYLTVGNVISIIGAVGFSVFLLVCLLLPRKYFSSLGEKTTKFFKEHKNAGEILRFVIVGGIATLIDMFVMGVVMYLMQKSIYTSFVNVFISAPTPSTLATIVGTSCGFCSGLLVNYILSIIFVFNEKGNSKSAKGFAVFTLLSIIGLLINIAGTYIGFDLLKINQWIVKIIMILVVLVYNYISKKLVLFKNKDKTKEMENK